MVEGDLISLEEAVEDLEMTERKNLKPQAEMNSFPVIAAEIPAQAEENCAFQMDNYAPIVSST